MIKIDMDMIQTIGLAVILLLIGIKLRKKVNFFEKYCIPAPVIGGFLFSMIVFILRQTNVMEIKFNDTLQKFFMVMFFTSVGFNASLKVLKKGGKKVVIFLFIAAGLCAMQNLVAVALSGFVGIPPLLALMTLRLWELIDLALPVFILLIAQIILIYTYLNVVTFRAMGSDYDAAVMVSGHCGFGMGATPNGISNMKAVTEKYVYSKMAFFVIPIVGSLFIDFANISIITIFTQFFK